MMSVSRTPRKTLTVWMGLVEGSWVSTGMRASRMASRTARRRDGVRSVGDWREKGRPRLVRRSFSCTVRRVSICHTTDASCHSLAKSRVSLPLQPPWLVVSGNRPQTTGILPRHRVANSLSKMRKEGGAPKSLFRTRKRTAQTSNHPMRTVRNKMTNKYSLGTLSEGASMVMAIRSPAAQSVRKSKEKEKTSKT
jgi:hypothetical protein